MAVLSSPRFGALQYAQEDCICFPGGLPGFEDQHEFLLLERESFCPLVFLQSVTAPELCLPAVPVSVIDPCYELALTAEEAALLGEGEQQVFAVVCLNAEGTACGNLLGPVVINSVTRRAVQSVRADGRYSAFQPLPVFAEAKPCS